MSSAAGTWPLSAELAGRASGPGFAAEAGPEPNAM